MTSLGDRARARVGDGGPPALLHSGRVVHSLSAPSTPDNQAQAGPSHKLRRRGAPTTVHRAPRRHAPPVGRVRTCVSGGLDVVMGRRFGAKVCHPHGVRQYSVFGIQYSVGGRRQEGGRKGRGGRRRFTHAAVLRCSVAVRLPSPDPPPRFGYGSARCSLLTFTDRTSGLCSTRCTQPNRRVRLGHSNAVRQRALGAAARPNCMSKSHPRASAGIGTGDVEHRDCACGAVRILRFDFAFAFDFDPRPLGR